MESFISTVFVVVKLNVFYTDSASMKWPLYRVFWLSPYSPKHLSVLLKFLPVVVSNRKTLFKKSFKILNFSINGRHLKFTVLFLFWAQFTTGKPKILLKTKMSTKTTSLGISNSVRLRPQNSCKIKQTRNIFWAQTWSKLPSFSFGVFFVLGFTWKKHYVFLV